MFLLRILPGFLKELVKHVPTVLFEVVEWNDLANEIPKISKRILQKEDFQAFFDNQKNYLAPFNVTLTQKPIKDTYTGKDHWVGEKILSLYFIQIFSPHGLFLDLRLHHFNPTQDELIWNPNAFWIKFTETFQNGLFDIYEGFYLKNDRLFRQGLIKTGLLSTSWPIEDQNELFNLFQAHFGTSLNEEMEFELEGLKRSMIRIADFLLKKKVKITKDFLYLGIYLIGLYSSLENFPYKYPAKNAYLLARQKNSKEQD